MRRAARTDENQQDIVTALRKCGATVAVTSAVGNGFPDLVATRNGKIWMFEIKDGAKSPSRRALTALQGDFHAVWPVVVLESTQDAVEALNGR